MSAAPQLGPVVRAVLGRPWLWAAAVGQALRLARWHRPGLARPDPDWWRFRMETAYGGDGSAAPDPDDVRSFLRWCAGMRRWRRR